MNIFLPKLAVGDKLWGMINFFSIFFRLFYTYLILFKLIDSAMVMCNVWIDLVLIHLWHIINCPTLGGDVAIAYYLAYEILVHRVTECVFMRIDIGVQSRHISIRIESLHTTIQQFSKSTKISEEKKAFWSFYKILKLFHRWF